MITLVVNEQPNLLDSLLELELIQAGLCYKKSKYNKYKLIPPIMVVDGVPLDMERAMKYIKESSHNE